ncbi:hypothetical protein F2Q68_00019524 [Brassica cretica]|uniref:Uncharacterized protein n=1 Tax=Brassica cretica TaxID=69181 RepID=A0A8S9FQL9_BRACR|nr:hypothetical protein F2Q68_00019524 [Brassica cretica]
MTSEHCFERLMSSERFTKEEIYCVWSQILGFRLVRSDFPFWLSPAETVARGGGVRSLSADLSSLFTGARSALEVPFLLGDASIQRFRHHVVLVTCSAYDFQETALCFSDAVQGVVMVVSGGLGLPFCFHGDSLWWSSTSQCCWLLRVSAAVLFHYVLQL